MTDENTNIPPENTNLGDENNFEGRDPMYPDVDKDLPLPPEEPENDKPKTFEPEKPFDITASIAKRLEGEEQEVAKEEGINPESPLPFDLTRLSKEQLQSLKSMLAATPDAQIRKKKNPTVFLRRIDGKMVQDFKRALLALVDDPENRRQVERHVIPVKFFGEDKYVDVLYSLFINSERVQCEVKKSRNEVIEIVEGEVMSAETGRLVDMVKKEVKYWFIVKLPDGEEVEIEAKVANG
jgi:hypothetical protein